MPRPKTLTRREALKTAALGALALPLLGSAARAANDPAAPEVTPSKADADGREHGLRLGVATYSTRTLPLDATIEALRFLRIRNAGVYKAHCDWEKVSVDEARAVGGKFRAAGIRITGSGVVNFHNDEPGARKVFENAQAAGMATIVCKPDLAALPLAEKLAKEYDQRLAIHNHGPEDKVYPSPYDVMKAIAPLDPRIGLCLDVGHAMRARTDPVEAIRQCASRLYDLHLKDSLAPAGADKDIAVEVGAGHLDIRGVLQALLDIRYSGVVAFEYEKPRGNPVTGLAESVGYVRGLLAGLAR